MSATAARREHGRGPDGATAARRTGQEDPGGASGREVVVGATGYLGRLLVRRLAGEGRAVRALARNPSRVELPEGVEPVEADLVSGEGLEEALDGCSFAYYLMHSMDAEGDFEDRDRRAAEHFVRAAGAADLERAVYLGGIVPAEGARSRHIASRLEVEEILLGALPRSTALRASIVVGAGSSSFRMLVRLVERLRVLPFPAWHENRTQPIAERDAVEYLARTPSVPGAEGRSLDVAGPDVLSYGQMIERIADLMGVGRLPLGLRLTQTPAASAVVARVTGQPLGLVRPLMESLESDLLPRDDAAREIYGLRPTPYDRAVNRALRDWEHGEALAAR